MSRLRAWWAGFGWTHRQPESQPKLTRRERELSITGLAGFCVHGVGMLDQCDGCCPPRTVKEAR